MIQGFYMIYLEKTNFHEVIVIDQLHYVLNGIIQSLNFENTKKNIMNGLFIGNKIFMMSYSTNILYRFEYYNYACSNNYNIFIDTKNILITIENNVKCNYYSVLICIENYPMKFLFSVSCYRTDGTFFCYCTEVRVYNNFSLISIHIIFVV